jgi:hypothetical protein
VQTWTFRAAVLGVLSAAALIGAAVGSPAGVAPATAADGFAGPLAAHVVARPLDRDLTRATRSSLHVVPCAAASAATACFAAGR